MIEVSLLGRVAVTVDGVPLSGEAAQRRRIALLALLCVPKPLPIRRDRLMLYLWPDSDTESARHVLSVAVHVLRKALGHEALITTADEIALAPEHLRVDVLEFEDALRRGDCAAASEAYGGPFMDGFHAGAGVDLEQWVDGERARLQRLFAQALEGVAADRRAAGDLAGAAEAWRRRAVLDPYSSQGALGLMHALAEAGDRAGAIRHAGIHKQLLEAELGAGPDPEVEALAEQLRTEPPAHVAAAPATGAARRDVERAGHREGEKAGPRAGRTGAAEGVAAASGDRWTTPAATGSRLDAGVASSPTALPEYAAGVAARTDIAPSRGPAASPSAAGDAAAVAGIGAVGDPGTAADVRTPVRGSIRPAAEPGLMPQPPSLRARWRAAGRKRWGVVAVGVALLVLAAFVAERWRANARAAAQAPRTLAVLPFSVVGPLAQAQAMEYLGDGIAEQILNELNAVKGLRVVSRSSSFTLRGADVHAVGDSLGVDWVLSGTVEPSGDMVRVAVELSNARDRFQIWRQSYDRPRGDVVALEDEIARATAQALDRRLRPPARDGRVPDPTAHLLYLRGIHFWYQRTPQSLLIAADTFARAVAIDSTYAQAWAWLAQTLSVASGYDYGALPPDSAFPRARAAALRALALDDGLAEAHTALASVYMNYEWNLPAAEREFQRAIEIDPSYSSAHQWYGLLLLVQKHDRQAWDEMERAAEGDPDAPTTFVQRGHYFYYMRQYDKAVGEMQRALQIDPGFRSAHLLMALTQIELGRAAETAAQLDSLRASAPEPVLVAVLGYACARSGQVGKARAARRELADAARRRYVPGELLALVDAALGDRSAAIDDLEEAYRRHSNGMIYLGIEPAMDPLRADPRFTSLISRVAAGREGASLPRPERAEP